MMESLSSRTLFVLCAGLLATFLIGRYKWYKKQKNRSTLQAVGIEAEATVLYVETVDAHLICPPYVQLRLQIRPSRGRNFVVETQIGAERQSPIFQVGQKVRIKYRAGDPTDIVMI